MQRKYDVVILDSGVKNTDNESGCCFWLDNHERICRSVAFADDIGHGTAVHGIIKLHNPDAKCFHIKIFNSQKDGIDDTLLLHALEYIYENINCRIINMSLGLTISIKKGPLFNICQKLKESGVIIVAAFDNMEVISYPAAFHNVIGVCSSDACKKITDIEYMDNTIVNVCAKGGLQRVNWIEPKYIFTQGNSYACAHVTGILSKSFCRNMSEALEYLKRIAIKSFHFKNNYEPPNYPYFLKGTKAVLFPFNKEMHSLIRFNDQLCINVVDVYDVTQSAKVKASTNKLLNISNEKDFIIKNIDEIDWNSFDTLVLGHTEELMNLLGNHSMIENLIITAYDNGKFIYCFDDISNIINKHTLSSDRVFYPIVKANNFLHIPFGMLYRPWVPLIGVFGTTSKQGKFTLQLILRQKFLRDNYCIGQIGTEPTAYLFGMDSCFHFGYHSTTDITRQNMICYLNSVINQISESGVDIIITGCQSGTVTYDYGNANYYTFPQTEFLLGTLPDAVVLCVNAYDDTHYINRTIKYIESAADCKVIAITVFPMGYDKQIGTSRLVRLPDEDIHAISINISDKTDIPVFILGNEPDMENLYSKIISFFTPSKEQGGENTNDD